MPTPASGSNAKVALKKQPDEDTLATGNFELIALQSFNLVKTEAPEEDPLVGQGRDAIRPGRGLISLGGNAVVPIDSEAIGHWLSMLLGAPTTTGSDPYTHVWESGESALIPYSIEQGHDDTDAGVFFMNKTVYANSGQVTVGPSGVARLSLELLATGQTEGTSTGAGTPTTIATSTFLGKQSFINRNAASLGNLLNMDLSLANNIDPDYYVGGGGLPGALPLGVVALSGSMSTRLVDLVLLSQASSNGVCTLDFGFSRSASDKITFEMPQVDLLTQGSGLEGPAGVELQFNILGSKTPSARALKVTLINTRATY